MEGGRGRERSDSCAQLPQDGSRGLQLASRSFYLQLEQSQHRLIPSVTNHCNRLFSRLLESTCAFSSLMNRHPGKLDCLFKCMIAVYDIVMDLESIIMFALEKQTRLDVNSPQPISTGSISKLEAERETERGAGYFHGVAQ